MNGEIAPTRVEELENQRIGFSTQSTPIAPRAVISISVSDISSFSEAFAAKGILLSQLVLLPMQPH
jgi:hypothetical protein